MEQMVRQWLLRIATGKSEIPLRRRTPSRSELHNEFGRIPDLGLYLHIPFCERICSYCPYNKELFDRDAAEQYLEAVRTEVDLYAHLVGDRPITSFYIGGGTPTTMLGHGLGEIVDHVRRVFRLRCDIHMESHPNHVNGDQLSEIRSMGVQHLSLGVEALQDRHLKSLGRPYTVEAVKEAVGRAMSAGFTCVNVDVMFGLPGQTCEEVEHTGHALVEMGVDQVAAYPLFRFPYTRMGRNPFLVNHSIPQMLGRRAILRLLERIFYRAGYQRTSVWAFTRRGVPRYCSVTVPLYLGLGASGGSYLRRLFYLNTFRVSEYIEALRNGRLPISLSVDLTERMQRAGWLYWRIYETRFEKADYRKRFGCEIDRAYGTYLKLLELLGFLKDDGTRIVLSDRGAFWLHALEDILSIDYIGKLWGTSQRNPWPDEVVLH
jgi:oxygen-independent coproporphyrinogen-3 oxidase